MTSEDLRVSRKGSTIDTGSGVLHIQPYRTSRGSSQLLAKLTFVPRASHFESHGQDAFRGFYVLFWIAIGLLILRTYVVSFDETGYPLSLSFAALFSKDALGLALSDAVLVGSTGISVPFVKLLASGRLRYNGAGSPGMIIQHAYQTLMLAVAVLWTFNRQWEWVQSGFFTLHCIVMLMKVHSYVSINGEFSELLLQKNIQTGALKSMVSKLPGGWSGAETEASDARTLAAQPFDERKDKESGNMSPGSVVSDTTPEGTPMPIADGVVIGTEVMGNGNDLAMASLRHRLATLPPGGALPKSIAKLASTNNQNGLLKPPSSAKDTSYFPSSTDTAFPPKTVESQSSNAPAKHPLIGHPNPEVNALAESISALDDEMTSVGVNGQKRVQFPGNVTLKNFADYQLIPTLVYELEYPRTERVRPFYIFEKTVAFLGTFTLLYTITEHYIIPLTPKPGQPFFRSLIDLALPFMLSYLLLFYIIFECICNGFAEIARFADRQFYEDWWNSTTWDEFARKWNKPVHSFLLRHVYASSIEYHKMSKPSATMVTFLLSAALHELVMAIVTKKLRLYLFVLQMAQVPMIWLGRTPFIRRNKILGNAVFWLGLMAGFPLLCVAYCAY
ncbi:hypothetical protein FRB96_002863 [Tulasnella sp. 330]|nr:hypothetical protein FRB96_002863 [Tulasnella sp. 330]KAG8875048.1 hypothetical protein FRB97_005469 [Tulasnella sp. 331]